MNSRSTTVSVNHKESILTMRRRQIRLLFAAALLLVDGANGWVTSLLFARSRTRMVGPSTSTRPVQVSLLQQVTHHQHKDITHQFTQHQQQNVTTIAAPPAVDVDNVYYCQLPLESMTTASSAQRITLTRYLDQAVKRDPELRDLQSLLLGLQMACKTISNLVNRAGLVYKNNKLDNIGRDNLLIHQNDPTSTATTTKNNNDTATDTVEDGRMQSMKRLDQLSTLVLRNALQYTGKCQVVSPAVEAPAREAPAEHQPGVLLARSLDGTNTNVTAVCDPLDGSGNADASVCTGTVFGVFDTSSNQRINAATTTSSSSASASSSTNQEDDDAVVQSVLQPAKNMRAAGYCLYSSATILVFTLGDDMPVQGFTLDPQLNEFVLTHPDLQCPPAGTIYSCNEGHSESGWDDGWRAYLRAIKTGAGRSRQRYAHRYVGSMVGDVHRTLLYGGIFAYPANDRQPDGNLQLLYKTAPLAYIVDRAGGRSTDGRGQSLLEVRPERVHQKSPCFLGSAQDVQELESYLYGSRSGSKSGGDDDGDGDDDNNKKNQKKR